MTAGIHASSDQRGKVHWVAASGIETIAADTAIEKGIVAICPESNVNIYFGTESGTTFPLLAGVVFAVSQQATVKLDAETKCLVWSGV